MIVKLNHRHFFVTMEEKIMCNVRVKFWPFSLPFSPNADCIWQCLGTKEALCRTAFSFDFPFFLSQNCCTQNYVLTQKHNSMYH